MATVLELSPAVGQVGTVGFQGLHVGVTVANVKEAYGRTLYYVVPAVGSGGTWIERERFTPQR